MIRVLALHNAPVDESTYTGYYLEQHMPIVREVPGVRNIRYGRVIRAADGGAAPYYLVSDVYFDDEAALEVALASPRMADALADVPNFATGGVTIMICDVNDIPPA